MEWGPLVEFYELRLDLMRMTYEMIGNIGRATTHIAIRYFIQSGLHSLLLSILPRMRISEVQMIECHLINIFLQHQELQYDLIEWIKEGLVGRELRSLEADKDWAVFALGKLIWSVRPPKAFQFKSTVITGLLFKAPQYDSQLAHEWTKLFLTTILPLFKMIRMDKFLYAYKLAFLALCQLGPVEGALELAWYNLTTMAGKLALEAQSMKDNELIQQISLFVGLYKDGLEVKYWPVFFKTLFSLVSRQYAADVLIGEMMEEPGLLMKCLGPTRDADDMRVLYTIMKGLGDWAKTRFTETANLADSKLLETLHSLGEHFINEHLIIGVLSKWLSGLQILQKNVYLISELSDKIYKLTDHWAILNKVTSLRISNTFDPAHFYVGLPTLEEGRSVLMRKLVRRASQGDSVVVHPQPENLTIEYDKRATETDLPVRSQTRPSFHVRRSTMASIPLEASESDQRLIRELSSRNWNKFTSHQQMHVLEELPRKPPTALHSSLGLVKCGDRQLESSRKRSDRKPRKARSDEDNIDMAVVDKALDALKMLEAERKEQVRTTRMIRAERLSSKRTDANKPAPFISPRQPGVLKGVPESPRYKETKEKKSISRKASGDIKKREVSREAGDGTSNMGTESKGRTCIDDKQMKGAVSGADVTGLLTREPSNEVKKGKEKSSMPREASDEKRKKHRSTSSKKELQRSSSDNHIRTIAQNPSFVSPRREHHSRKVHTSPSDGTPRNIVSASEVASETVIPKLPLDTIMSPGILSNFSPTLLKANSHKTPHSSKGRKTPRSSHTLSDKK